jgi:hypothetical protein
MRHAAWLIVVALAAGCGAAASDAGREPRSSSPAVAAPTVAEDEEVSTRAVLELSEGAQQSWKAVPPPRRAQGCDPGSERKLGNRSRAFAGIVKRRVVAYPRPGGDQLRSFGRRNANDYPMIFGVLAVVHGADCRPAWYRVQLPIRPNGSVGYVQASALELASVRTRIAVDLSERKLEFFRDGTLVETFRTAIGSPATPTPIGRYYVNQRLIAGNPNGPHGPAALGISAFSPVLTHWTQGGPIAIHGTNDPGSIGKAMSNGCLRLRNADLIRLYEKVPAGTPVVIRR